MPANRCNYIVLYENQSQIYSSSTKQVALQTPPPDGSTLEQKNVLFITYQPDDGKLSVHKIDQEEVLNAELKYPKSKARKKDEDQTNEE